MSTPIEQWQAYCQRMADLGASLADDRFPAGDRPRADGIRHLMRNMAMTLIQASEYEDADFPQLYRSYAEMAQWGAPNIDNVYLSAAVSPRHTYRLAGNLRRCPGLIVQVTGRATPDDPIGVLVERNADELDVDADGSVEVFLGGAPEGRRNWIPLPDTAVRLSIREYLIDWEHDRRPGFTLERLGDEPAVPRRWDATQLAGVLERSAAWLEHAVPFWNGYIERRRDEIGDNRCSLPEAGTAMGATDIFYATGFFALQPDEALLVEFAKPAARYWSVQLYSRGWYEPLDVDHRQSSLNDHQAHVDADGVVRMVVSPRDPGTQNWLDTDGHLVGVITFRAVWCSDAPGALTTTVVPVDGLSAHLPAGHPRCDAAARADQLARRRRALTRRRTS